MNLFPRHFLYKHGKITNIQDFILLGARQGKERSLLTLSDHERAVHTYICGVTGGGKSRFLESMIMQDIALGHPLCVIDPTGHLFRQAADFIACAVDHARHQLGLNEEQIEETLANYLFLDVDDPLNPLRLNPLEPQAKESTEEIVDDLLKTTERLFGAIDDMRRIRQTLRNTLWVIVELNRLEEERRPSSLAARQWPLNLHFAGEFLATTQEHRLNWLEAVPETPENRYVLLFWKQFFSQYTPAQRMERLESTWNILQYFLGDSLVNRFFDVQYSSFHIPELMRQKKSLFCSLPLGKNLKGSQLIGAFLATKFQRAAYRRTPIERQQPYYLFIDEFHEFADLEFAKAAATLRQYNLRMVNAHQSQSQPPFHTAEGRSILNTIKANSQIKVLFRLAREDAETMMKEVFELSQRRLNFRTLERSVATAQGLTRTQTISFQHSRGVSDSWSRASSVGWAKTDTLAMGYSHGTNIGKTLTHGVGSSIADGLSRSITHSESEGVTESHSKTHGISVALGKNWSHMRDHRRGVTFTHGRGESLAICHGQSQTHTEGSQTGRTDSTGGSSSISHGNQHGSSSTTGSSYAVADGQGNSFVSSNGESLAFHDSGMQSRNTTGVSSASNTSSSRTSSSHGSSTISEMTNTSRAQTQTYNSAIQMMRNVADAFSQNSSETRTNNRNSSTAHNTSDGESHTTGGSDVRTTSESETVSAGNKKEWGRSESHGRTCTLTKSQQESLAQAFTLMEQVSRTMSRALQETASKTATLGGSIQETVSESEALARAMSETSTDSVSERKIFFTLEGEREVLISQLQKLPRRRCIVTKEALGAMEIETLHVPDWYYFEKGERLPEKIIERQRERYGALEAIAEDIENAQLLSFPHRDNVHQSDDDEDWFPDW